MSSFLINNHFNSPKPQPTISIWFFKYVVWLVYYTNKQCNELKSAHFSIPHPKNTYAATLIGLKSQTWMDLIQSLEDATFANEASLLLLIVLVFFRTLGLSPLAGNSPTHTHAPDRGYK